MPRLTPVGPSAQNLQQINVANLPENVDWSVFKWCHLTGTAKAGGSWGFVTTVECRVDADLRGLVRMPNLESWGSDWQGVRLTNEQADLCGFDVIRGFILPRLLFYRGLTADQKTAIAAADFAPGQHKTSWSRMRRHWASTLGLDPDDPADRAIVQAHAEAIFGNHMGLLAKMKSAVVEDDTDPRKMANLAVISETLGRMEVPVSNWSREMVDALRDHDRWQIAREAENWLARRHPDQAPWLCRVWRTFPESESAAYPESEFAGWGRLS